MNRYEKPDAEVLSFRPDEALMDQNISGDLTSGIEQGGGSPYDARDSKR